MSRLQWLTIPAVDATASAVKTAIEKLACPPKVELPAGTD
jgi:hypothetical protein